MQNSKDNRAATSCSECQRRKQKCSREWPCNHCQARKVPHLCQFGPKKGHQESPTTSSESKVGQKRALVELSEELSLSRENSGQDEPQDGLKAWGYMPGHVHYKIGQLDRSSTQPSANGATNTESNSEVEKVLHAVPPRSLTDAIVNHFLTVVNYRYNAIYGPTFTEQYVQWWSDRAADKQLSPEFTCLLLRLCAYSVQYLTTPLRKTIEFEMASSSQQLTDRFATAAEQLSATFSPSESSLERVQEQFLKGAWLKSESKIVESWHALGCTIREAQELGIDKDTGLEGLAEFDIEIRRRLWTLLYIWDWQMSAWLGRPHLIDQKDCTFTFPNLRLDESAQNPNLVSPFAHMALQAMLARRIAQHMGDIQVISTLSGDQVLAVEAECDKFIEELPAVFRIRFPDKSLDEDHPHYVFQRCQLHVVIYMTMLDFLKSYLTRSPQDRVSDLDDHFRNMGVDLSLKLLKVARQLFDHEFPINAKFHLVVFCIFDTAAVLCSALIHDTRNDLPHREDIMDAVEGALDMLHQLSMTSKIGASSYRFLFRLVETAPVLSQRSSVKKRRVDKVEETSVSTGQSTTPVPAAADPFRQPEKTEEVTSSAETIPQIPTTDDLSFDLDNFLQQNPFGADSQLDLGGLEVIWDWDNLNLDAILGQNPPPPASTAGG
ncbi:hypothetical protein BDV96DRAFT_504972 [Lophiotrema nucula]|uniref:Zn(2)-C6 fungal-type domain-containing protein n=1 Tax=Lophiotrema nucula TaxID=690887 RepID=A0A6A5YM96_9PLEO|nr:hypothetical protein BDV96DRAFT_504972 [Lophiotrema nucula]